MASVPQPDGTPRPTAAEVRKNLSLWVGEEEVGDERPFTGRACRDFRKSFHLEDVIPDRALPAPDDYMKAGELIKLLSGT